MNARRLADVIIFEEIARRRRHGTDEGDLLSALIALQDGDGEALTDQELRDQVVGLIAGGYETTSALAAWVLYAVLADPVIEGRLRAELEANRESSGVDIDALPYLDAVVSETLRLHSPAGFAGRKAEVDIEFAGHTIPAGRACPPRVAHPCPASPRPPAPRERTLTTHRSIDRGARSRQL